MTPKRF